MSTVHRLLDDAFAAVPLTPEVQDLKEEIRAGLVDRAAELEAAGNNPDEAARRALDELGDIAALVAEVAATGGGAGAGSAPAHSATRDAAVLARVRPRPGFVVGVAIASLTGAAAVGGLAALTIPGSPWAAEGLATPVILALVAALLGAGVIRAALLQETTNNHPLPTRRATAWGGAAGLVILGLGVAASAWAAEGPAGRAAAAVGAALVVGGAAWLSWLGATQTNRKKAWVRDAARAYAGMDRFSRDPAVAARFGLYTVVIWLVAGAAAVVVGVTAGRWWAALPLVAGFAVMMLVQARMQFGAETTNGGSDPQQSSRSD